MQGKGRGRKVLRRGKGFGGVGGEREREKGNEREREGGRKGKVKALSH